MTDKRAAKADILIVDDTPENLQVLSSMLSKEGYKVRPANSGQLALRTAHHVPPDLVLLDINMPEMNGYEVCNALKAAEQLAEIPVLFISALDATDDKIKAFQVGGVDYITKPFQFPEVLARVETHLMLYRQRKEIERLREEDRSYFDKLAQMKDEVLHTVSHDLRNPLGWVKNALYLLEHHGDMTDEKGKKYLDMIDRSADRMIALTTDLLDIAALETGLGLDLEQRELNSYAGAAVEPFTYQAQEQGLALEFLPYNGDLPVAIDHNRILQVLSNLISNAIKYTPSPGTVRLGTDLYEDQALIYVEDTGLGIPESDIPHLFDKFHRVETEEHLAAEGTGLGLSIVKTIVEQHDGRVWVESQLGAGSRFNVCLPIITPNGQP